MDTSTAELQRLGRRGFSGTQITDSDGLFLVALVYTRWWSCGVLDVVTVLGEDEAAGYRAGDLDPRRPEDLRGARVRWRTTGTVIEVAGALLDLPAPPEGGIPISVRPADERSATRRAEELWTP